jgi:hypothetical protein
VASNTGTSNRTGALLIGGQTVTITQSAPTAPAAPGNLRVMTK